MFDFDGKVRGSGSRVDLSGRGRKGPRQAPEESRSDFVKRQHQEREARERKRIREAASRHIQAVYRGHRCRRAQQAEKRQVFDKRYADISKVSGVLPAPQKAKFVFQLLVPMLRLFAFFFRKDQDEERLLAMAELVHFSSTQAESCNFLRIFLMDESQLPKDSSRQGALSLLEKLFWALLSCQRNVDVLKLLKAVQQALFSPSPDYKPLGSISGAVVAHLLRRTPIFQVLPPLCQSGQLLQAADVVLLMCSGLEAVSLETVEASLRTRQDLLTELLSTPNLVEALCKDLSHPIAVASLRRLSSLLVHTAGVLATKERPTAAPLLVNIATLLERFALKMTSPAVCVGAELLALLTWLSWAKAGFERGEEAKPGSATLARLHRPDLD
ncbi:Arylsulfatase B [Durusdinium trenchii]|uniref:HECT-type E3 ubiquitin transferase n=1 Tax=Durusdinium trenchii TaxID=1381693 RepID=A0ABP0NRA0_9DINO